MPRDAFVFNFLAVAVVGTYITILYVALCCVDDPQGKLVAAQVASASDAIDLTGRPMSNTNGACEAQAKSRPRYTDDDASTEEGGASTNTTQLPQPPPTNRLSEKCLPTYLPAYAPPSEHVFTVLLY